MNVYILDYNGSIIGVYRTEEAAGEALMREARLDPDSAEGMALTKHEVLG